MYFQVFSLSAVIHLGIGAILYWTSAGPTKDPTVSPEIVEIEFIDLGDSRTHVAFTEAPNLDLIDQQKTNLISKETQRVEEQSVAKNSGKTVNRSLQNIEEKYIPGLSGKNENGLKKLPTDNENRKNENSVVSKLSENTIYKNLFRELGVSRIQNRIFEDIKEASFTSLNTDRHNYYSFYSRVEEQIRNSWYSELSRHIEEAKRKPEGYRAREWVTQLVVLVDPEGKIVRNSIYRTSGKSKYDKAAKDAFKKAAPFLNPPEGMLNENGLIRLRYTFSLKI
ncbi:MAG: TonB family protein [Bdellovibrionales bacterium]